MNARTLLVASILAASSAYAQDRSIQVKIKTKPTKDWTQHKNIAVGDFVAADRQVTDRALDISESIAQVMTEAKVEGQALYDRNQLGKVLKDQKTQNSGVFDESSVVQIGKLIGSGIMIMGRVKQDEPFQTKQNTNNPFIKGNFATTEAEYILAVNFVVVDLKTGQTLESFDLDAKTSSKKTTWGYRYNHSNSGDLNTGDLKLKALAELKHKLRRMVVPTEEMQEVKFKADPAFNKQLQAAERRFELDETEEAIAMMKAMADDATLKPAAQQKAKYNYGVILMALDDCRTAVECFKAASLSEATSKKDYEDYRSAYSDAKEQCAIGGK